MVTVQLKQVPSLSGSGYTGLQIQTSLLASAHAHALSQVEDGFVYVLVAVRMFLEEWQGMDEIGVFIDKLLEACDKAAAGSGKPYGRA